MIDAGLEAHDWSQDRNSRPVKVHTSKCRRIVHVINSLNMGGAETMLARLVSSDAGTFEHLVLPLLEGGAVTERVRLAGALEAPLRVDGIANLATAPFRLAGRLTSLQPALVHGWLLQGNLAATVGTALARIKTPVLWNVRWTLYDLQSERLRTQALLRLSALLAHHPKQIVFNSRAAVAQHTAIGFPPGKAHVIPNGFDLGRFRPDPEQRAAVRGELKVPAGAMVVGMVARYHPMKDHEVSLRAAARVVARGVDAIFVYAGRNVDDANSALARLIAELGLGARVRLLGERQDVERLYASFDLYWMSSWARGIAEGFPNVIAEAMACGVPCVATDVGDAAWIIGTSGRVVPPRLPQALGDAAAELLATGPDALNRMGLDARARIQRKFALDSVVDAYRALYEEVLRAAP
jgi:glycosyltransferase involved in cell wall biosynthesis